MSDKYVYKIATEKDISNLLTSDVEYHYLKSIRSEITGENASDFMWIIMKNELTYCGYSRSKKVSGWWIMEGLYIDKKVNDIWAAYKLTLYTIHLLQNKKNRGILSWMDASSFGKANIFLKNGFIVYPKNIYRFILYKRSIEEFISLYGKEVDGWKEADTNDYWDITELSNNGKSFVNSICIDDSEHMAKWIIKREGSRLVAAVCWWRHDDLVEIHYSLSENANYDCIGGMIKAVQIEYDDSLTMARINLESERFVNLLKILKVRPCTYNTGYIHQLLKYSTDDGA